MNKNNNLKKLGLLSSFAIYIPAALLMYFLTKYLIPYLSEATGQETILFWFIVGGLGIFTPLIITAWIILRSEGFKISKTTWKQRLRFSKPTKKDILWSIGALLVVGALSGITMKLLTFSICFGLI